MAAFFFPPAFLLIAAGLFVMAIGLCERVLSLGTAEARVQKVWIGSSVMLTGLAVAIVTRTFLMGP